MRGSRYVAPAASSNGLLTGLTSYWKFDNNGSGGVSFVDSHGGHDWTGLLPGRDAPLLGTGKLNGCIQVDPGGSETFVELLDPDTANTGAGGSFSISGWFNQATPREVMGMDRITDPGGDNDYSFYLDADGHPGLLIGGSDLSYPTLTHSEVATAGAWHFLVGYFNSSNNTLGLALDGGAFETTSTLVGNLVDAGHLQIDASSDNSMLDEFAFWAGRVLSITDVAALYNSGAGLDYESFT